MLSADDITAITLTLKLAGLVTILLLLVGTPLAWWLATTRSSWRTFVAAIVALPLVLPPTVLGFYLLLALGPEGYLQALFAAIGIELRPFTFASLVLGSCVYSLPFVVQPLQNAMQAIGREPLEAAATLGAGPWDRFWHVVVPLSRPGFFSAAILGFAHTLGEFGVVLMLGGNIPGETRVAAIQIYDYVELLEYSQAHVLSVLLVVFAFAVLWLLHQVQGRKGSWL